MLSNFDLIDYAKKEGLDLLGVYSKDMLPDKKKLAHTS
jgi:hypothetical protein